MPPPTPTPQAVEDFTFLTNTELHWLGHDVSPLPPPDPSGYSALECWFAFDTHGVKLPCREPELLARARRAKASWNAQIKEWAQDVGLLLGQGELWEYCHNKPRWIFEATLRQAGKRLKSSTGFVPRFARMEFVRGQWWPPEMDRFDPGI